MKITIDNHVIEVAIHLTSTTPMGGNYYTIDYTLAGASLASCGCGPMHARPNPLDMLSAERDHSVRDYRRPHAATHAEKGWNGKMVAWSNDDPAAGHGTVGDREAAWLTQKYTIREKILWTLSQIVAE